MRNRISSRENQILKECLRLEKRKFRDKENRFIIEGPDLVNEAIARGRGIKAIIVREGIDFNTRADNIYEMEEKLFEKVSGTQHSQGVLAIVEKPEISHNEVFAPEGSCILVLDRLQDPGNIGTLIRTCEAAGYAGIICVKGTADPFSPKTVRAAAGAILRVPILFTEDEDETIELLHSNGKIVVVTLPNGDNKYYNVNLSSDIALVVGNEGNGCSRRFIDEADISVSIPMEGEIESLNASMAAGILMYERIRYSKR